MRWRFSAEELGSIVDLAVAISVHREERVVRVDASPGRELRYSIGIKIENFSGAVFVHSLPWRVCSCQQEISASPQMLSGAHPGLKACRPALRARGSR
jgi:hypothetical protein